MKARNKILRRIELVSKILVLLLSFSIFFSCNEEEFLEEVPLSFYSPENSFITYSDFVSATNNLYTVYRDEFYTSRNAFLPPRITITATDLVSYDQNAANLPDLLVPTSEFVYSAFWKPAYKMIFDANVIIERSETEISELTEEQKKVVQAEAKFFRGYLYKLLADIHGGVPIVLNETKEPKRDYIRSTRTEVYEQSVSDLESAAENLPDISEAENFRVNKIAAYHALAEVYLSLEQYNNAIDAATSAINHPNMELMKERFGSRVNDVYNPDFPWASGGDPYWDLFRKDNQNRSSGNTEAIWILEYAFNISGGAEGGYRYETAYNPRTWRLKVQNDDGSSASLIPYPNTYYGGRGAGQTKMSNYFYKYIWNQSGEEDIRNSEYNIVRDVKVNNPSSDYHGKWVLKDNAPLIIKSDVDTTRDWYPIVAKISSMGDHPKEIWQTDQTVYGSISSAGGPANTTHSDIYRMRLAETYLLRAEAYFRKGAMVNAANDINQVRRRSNAPDVDPNDVDIDYLLDERARELTFEENRLQTLSRLGLVVERSNKYNTLFKYYEHQNLWPVPFSEIEKNTEADLGQNPGY